MTVSKNRTFSNFNKYSEPNGSSAMQDFPIQPIEYGEGEGEGIRKRLSSCGKIALMEKTENIARITEFLNDNDENIVFVRGDEDSFFSSIVGWAVPRTRGNNFVEGRLKLLISSGILAHWEFMHKLWKPENLLDSYANWTHPRVEKVSKLNFSSKITTGFFICGVCLVICVILLLGEIVRFKLNAILTWWIYKSLNDQIIFVILKIINSIFETLI